eukprot:gene8650-7882_t
MLSLASAARGGCTDGGGGGCSRPTHPKWDTWSMAASTYTYCYGGGLCPPLLLLAHTPLARWRRIRVNDNAAGVRPGCVVDWLMNNTGPLGLNKYACVVGVDHYWTHQGVPCRGGQPAEFAMQ